MPSCGGAGTARALARQGQVVPREEAGPTVGRRVEITPPPCRGRRSKPPPLEEVTASLPRLGVA